MNKKKQAIDLLCFSFTMQMFITDVLSKRKINDTHSCEIVLTLVNKSVRKIYFLVHRKLYKDRKQFNMNVLKLKKV